MNLIKLIEVDKLENKKPTHFVINKLDLVAIKNVPNVYVLYGRCLHRGALMADGYIEGDNLICGLHGWDYNFESGVSGYNNNEKLHKFFSKIENNIVYIDLDEVNQFLQTNPQPFNRDEYLGVYADTHLESTEPYTNYIKELAKNGLKKWGHHGLSVSMGVDRNTLPKWEDIQFLPAQLHTKPLLDSDNVNTEVIIGKNAKKPLILSMPIFVSDMSFGALSKEAKLALSIGANLANTAICSGEGGMLLAEQENNQRYMYEFASGEFGFSWDKVAKCQAFHFKGGQGAKTGTGGHLPGSKVTAEIAQVRGLAIGEPAISPATFLHLQSVNDFKEFASKVRNITGGIPIGFKIAASHIEQDIQFALDVGVDYIILDGRGGGTGSAPSILRDNINVPTIPALARAKKYLNSVHANHISLIITGGLRIAEDFSKALMLGADAIAIANSALQAIGCIGMRACGTNNCPVGIATQKENLRNRLIIESSAQQLFNFLHASNDLIKVIARACGYNNINKFNMKDLSTFKYEMHQLTGISFAGVI